MGEGSEGHFWPYFLLVKHLSVNPKFLHRKCVSFMRFVIKTPLYHPRRREEIKQLGKTSSFFINLFIVG